MIDELKEEEIVNKVGGRFKLSTLIQKRMIALNQGARAAGRHAGRRQDDDRDPGDHAGEDLPGPVGQAPDGRADRGAGDATAKPSILRNREIEQSPPRPRATSPRNPQAFGLAGRS